MSGNPSPRPRKWKHRPAERQESLPASARASSISSSSEFLDGPNQNKKALAAPAVFEQPRATPQLEARLEQLEERLSRRLQDVERRLGRLDDVERRLSELEANKPAHPTIAENPEVANQTDFDKLKREGEELQRQDIVEAAGDPLSVEQVALEGTIWDCLLLITLRRGHALVLSPVQICCVVLLGLINAALQSLFIIGIEGNMIQDPVAPDIRSSLLSQRLRTNQHVDQLDDTTLLTKASLLCDQKVYSSIGQLHEDLSNYLTNMLPGFKTGEVISMLAMFFWTLTMTQEMQRIFLLAKTVLHLRKLEDSGTNVVINEESNGYDIVRMSTARKLGFIFAVLLPRAVLGMMLLFFGVRWLADTLAVSDLILNACALEIVKSVDEALFAAVLTGIVKVECFQFEPMTVAPPRQATKLTRQCLMFLAPCFFIVGVLAWGHVDTLNGFVRNVETAHRYLCEEDLDFVHAKHRITMLPFFSVVDLNRDTDGESVEKQFKCAFAAGEDMIAIRAGFEPRYVRVTDTLKAQIHGTDASCSVNGSHGPQESPCPAVDLGRLYEVRSLTEKQFLSAASGKCRDLVVHMHVLHEVCTQPDFAGEYQNIFSGRPECKDMPPVCQCLGERDKDGYCSRDQRPYMEVVQAYNITIEWLQYIQNVCPRSCNMCQRPPDQEEESPSSADGATTSAAEPDSETAAAEQIPNVGAGDTTSAADVELQTT